MLDSLIAACLGAAAGVGVANGATMVGRTTIGKAVLVEMFGAATVAVVGIGGTVIVG